MRDTKHLMSISQTPAIVIAGIGIQICLPSQQAADYRRLLAPYAAYLPADASCDLCVEVDIQPGAPFIPLENHQGSQVRVTRVGERLWYESFSEQGWIDFEQGKAALVARPNASLEFFLRLVIAWQCLQRGWLLVHASAVCRVGVGFVFIGPSGAGKSTTAQLSHDATIDTTILGDDVVVVGEAGDGWRVYGVPFSGSKFDAAAANTSAPLRGVYSLVQAHSHQLRPLPGPLGAAKLVSCLPFVMTTPTGATKALDTCNRLTAAIPVYELSFRKDPGFWALLLDSPALVAK